MQTSNPVLSDRVFEGVRPVSADDVMTIDGTVNKSLISIFITIAAAYWSFGNPALSSWAFPAIIVAGIVALITFFKAPIAPYTTPLYAVLEGIGLGAISFYFEAAYGGIVFQAVSLTFAVLLGMLLAYKSGVIKATPTFKKIVIAGTFGIFLFYMASIVSGLFGYPFTFMQETSAFTIGLSLFICGFAAMNLILDFDQIETVASRGNAPRYMEWYCALGLLVTLVWLYIELLNLLRHFQGRD